MTLVYSSRVPPPAIAALALKSPRQGQIAARFHALETHFKFFRVYHRELVKENTTLSKDLKAAQRELERRSEIPNDVDQLQKKLAQAQLELTRAHQFLDELREFVAQGWVQGEPSASNSINYTP
jgi:DNA-binding transcriptional regulator GbsR (MarR family)